VTGNDSKPKRPFMPMRDGAGSFDLNYPDDGTPIKEMLSFQDRLLLITEKCTYEVVLADQIDPERTNPQLPHNTQRKLLDYGIGSVPLRKILLQARTLFKEGFLSVDIKAAQELALTALVEFDALEQTVSAFKDLEKAAIDRAEKRKPHPRSFSLPSTGGVDAHCKTFAQKAHYFGRSMLMTARLFLPDATNWDKLSEIAKAKYGNQDQFSRMLVELIPNLKMVLNLRDALEHQNKGILVRDFTLEVDGTIAPPTVELDFRKSVLPRTSVASLMDELIIALPVYFEMLIVHLSSKFVQPIAGCPTFVSELPQSFQTAQYVRFGYWANMPGGGTMPFS
jgi:hypothetical protein